MTGHAASDRLVALERRGDELRAFGECQKQANEWMRLNRTDALVEELRQALADKRRIKLGTVNTLILLAHIDRLEAEVAKGPVVKP